MVPLPFPLALNAPRDYGRTVLAMLGHEAPMITPTLEPVPHR